MDEQPTQPAERASEPGSESNAPETEPSAAVTAEETVGAEPPAPSRIVELERRLRTAHIVNGVLAALVAILLVVAVVVAVRPWADGQALGQGGATEPGTTEPGATGPAETAPAQQIPDLARRDPNDPLAIGAVDAPVVVIEWLDYRCPYCAAFTNGTMPTIIEEYVDAGLVRYEFNEVVFFGEQSFAAAVAARAAGEQGRFHEYLTTLFAAAPTSGHPELPRETLIAFAETAGVPDLAKFTADLDSPELAAAVQASHDRAVALGVSSVPTFLIDQTVLQGAYPIDAFREAIDSALAAAQG